MGERWRTGNHDENGDGQTHLYFDGVWVLSAFSQKSGEEVAHRLNRCDIVVSVDEENQGDASEALDLLNHRGE